MKRILVLYDKDKLGMTDFAATDYMKLNSRVEAECGGIYPNFGNKVWMQGLVSEITTDGIMYDLAYTSTSPEQINENYDAVILPMANIFHKGWIPWLEARASYIEQIIIPVFVIACGIQIKYYDEMDQLIINVEKPARRFIESIYSSGGEFGLRGEVTKDFFDRLGYHSAVVTGCPSLFQMGREFRVDNHKVSRKDFKSAIHGDVKTLGLTRKSIASSDYIDQGSFGHLLYDPDYLLNNPVDDYHIRKLIRKRGLPFVKSIANDRIRLFADLQQWMNYYKESEISFSYGSRIHGTIMPILSGVPSMLYACDMRTEEMADYFDIPFIKPSNKTSRDLYDLYCETDYTKFNETYAQKYDIFEGFFVSHGLCSKLNQNNVFLNYDQSSPMPERMNQDYRSLLKKQIEKKRVIWSVYQFYDNIRVKQKK